MINTNNTEEKENICYHMNILIEPLEIKDYDGNKEKILNYFCQDCGKIIYRGKNLNEKGGEIGDEK